MIICDGCFPTNGKIVIYKAFLKRKAFCLFWVKAAFKVFLQLSIRLRIIDDKNYMVQECDANAAEQHYCWRHQKINNKTASKFK